MSLLDRDMMHSKTLESTCITHTYSMLQGLKKSLKKLKSKLHETKKSHFRSPKWDDVRNMHLSLHGECAACGSEDTLQVHHIKPFRLHPELELKLENLITLCMGALDCHLEIGHGGSFKSYNPNVVEDAARFKASSQKEREQILIEVKANRKK